jgi:hypothetical protein
LLTGLAKGNYTITPSMSEYTFTPANLTVSVGERDITGNNFVAVAIANISNWTSISVGHGYTCGTRTDGSLWCWGYNYYGELGDGTNSDKNTPIQIGSATNWASISAGAFSNFT